MAEKVPQTDTKTPTMYILKYDRTRDKKLAKCKWRTGAFLGQGHLTIRNEAGQSLPSGYVGHGTFPNSTHTSYMDAQTNPGWGKLNRMGPFFVYDSQRALLHLILSTIDLH